jgi:hypothetical protein
MPSPTGNQLLQRAIPYAAKDRASLYYAYGGEGDAAKEAMETRTKILGLAGKKFKDLEASGMDVARLAFIFAEQYENSVAESLRGTNYKGAYKRAVRNVNLFRRFRLEKWGRTALEKFIKDASAVDVHEILSAKRIE